MRIVLCLLGAILGQSLGVSDLSDFESGTMSPWFDLSSGRVNWRVEDLQSPAEVNSPAPRPPSGSKYLRATRNADLASGLASLHGPVFTALPGDQVEFSFWIRSQQPEGNSLELFYSANNTETLLMNLSQFSLPSNFEWRTVSVQLPFSAPTAISLVFYGLCGSNGQDAIALDDIFIGPSASTTDTPATTARPGCNAVLNSPSGSFHSPNYPDNYDNDLECNWLIVTSSGTRISLILTDFDTQLDSDVVRIYDGGSTSRPLLASASGDSAPAAVQSSDNVVLVTFTTDGSVTYGGFLASYESLGTTTESTTTERTTTADQPRCEDSYVSGSGYISSPNYPDDYPNGVDCFWYLEANGGSISLQFEAFSTQLTFDYLEVFEGWSNSTLLLFASGSSIPNGTHTTRTNRMLVYFHTSASVTAGGFRAFFDEYKPLHSSSESAGRTLTSDSGELSSTDYPKNSVGQTRVHITSGRRIRVAFTEFDTGSDSLTIFDGATTLAPRLLRASGSALPTPVTSSSNEILVQFTTDASGNSFKGWHLVYSMV